MSLKRRMAEGIGRLLGLYVAPKREVWNIVQREVLQLHKFKFGKPFLKTDAQGADLAVIKGAGSRLHDLVGLQTELSFARMYDGQDDYRPAIGFLEQNGFELSALFPLGMFPRLAEMDCVMFNSRFLEIGP